MALTTEQLLLINNLIYSRNPSMCGNSPQTSYEGRTVGDMINNMTEQSAKLNADGTSSAAEWTRMIEQVRSDPQLMNMRIVNTELDSSTNDAHALLVDPSTNEAVVVFRGTGSGEWRDNFLAGSTMKNGGSDPTISPQQQKALDYVSSLKLEQYDSVTVTGHSKGGNKAKICALLCREVDNCVSFDGQGFSDEFVSAHQGDIARNQGKIHNHNVDGDFVNILLNDVGETTYYEGQRVGKNFAKNHDPSSFWTNEGTLKPGPQRQEMKDLDAFLNSLLRSTSQKDKAKLLDFAGEIANATFGEDKDHAADNLREVLLDPRYTDQAAYLIAYTLKYENETGKITSSISKALDSMGLSDFSDIADIANKVLGNSMAFGAIKWAMQHGEDIPDWVVDLVRKWLKIPLSNKELRQLLRIVARAGDMIDDIHIDAKSGADIKVAPLPPIDDIDPGDPGMEGFDFSFEDGFIFAELYALADVCQEMRTAVENYNCAIDQLRQAAEALASRWQGEGRDAFYENQMKAFKHYYSLYDLCRMASEKIEEARERYSHLLDHLKQLM